MDGREQRGLLIAATCQLTKKGRAWLVPSQSGKGRYTVVPDPAKPHCTCLDHTEGGNKCKHIFAVEFAVKREENPDGSTTVTQTVTVTETIKARKTYPQVWEAYNTAQTHEKEHFLPLLADLCAGIPQPPENPKGGHKAARIADAVFGAVYKVYSMVSMRRFMTDMREATERGHVQTVLSYNCILDYMGYDSLTPILVDLIGRASLPLRTVERTFAIDSSGFSTCRYSRWFDEKYGANRAKADWVKTHLCIGTQTQIVAAVVIGDKNSGDCPQFEPLTRTTAENFTVEEMSGDKAYLSRENLDLIASLGGTAFIPFKTNSLPGGSEVWRRMFWYFTMNREDFLNHYHRRSNVESAFSMIKRKFGDNVRAKTDTAMKNEVLAKVLCHNLCCLISAWYELGIEPDDWMPKKVAAPASAAEGPRDVLRFPAG